MFDIFKKKRIAKYLPDVKRYIAWHFEYEPEKEETPERQYSIADVPLEEKFRERYSFDNELPDEQYSIETAEQEEEVEYSDRTDESIPNAGDHFKADFVINYIKTNKDNFNFKQMQKEMDAYLNLTFVDMLIRYINEKGWRDSRVYKSAQMDRRLFSKIMSDRNYKPSKDTALALVIALELNFKQAKDLLSRAGYTLSHSNKRDVIIEYFIREGIYNLQDINDVLYNLDQKLIGR